jgi:hypothetical protein
MQTIIGAVELEAIATLPVFEKFPIFKTGRGRGLLRSILECAMTNFSGPGLKIGTIAITSSPSLRENSIGPILFTET